MGLCLAFVACGAEPVEPELLAAGPDRAIDPEQRGPYQVGVVTVTVEDPDRSAPPGFLGNRRFRVEIWYPAVDAAQDEPRDVLDLFAEAPASLLPLLENLDIPKIPQDAAREAEVRTDQGLFPLVLFSHGNGGIRAQSFSYTNHLASHGYVVVAPDHQGNTIFDLVDDPDLQGSGFASIFDRPQDLTLLLDLVADGKLTDDGAIEATVDLRRVGVTGHSFGGLTSLLIANPESEFFDPRVDAVVPVTPATQILGLVAAPIAQLAVPVLYVGATTDQTLSYQAETLDAYAANTVDKAVAGVIGAGHFSFSELCELDLAAAALALGLDASVAEILADGCGAQNIPVSRAHALNNRYGAAWFAVYLRDSEPTAAQWLTDASAPDDVEFLIER